MHIHLQNNLRVEATPMQTLVFHPQSHWLAVSFLSGAVRIFDVETQVSYGWLMVVFSHVYIPIMFFNGLNNG